MTTLAARANLILRTLITDSDGQGLVEYALILVLVVVAAVVAMTFLGGRVTSELSTVASSMVPQA